MLILSLMLSAQTSFAQDCKQLRREITKATPANVAGMYLKLVECNPSDAKRLAPTTMTTAIADENGYAAAVAAVKVGSPDATSTWIQGLRSDERAEAIRTLGKACQDSEEIQGYFIERAKSMGDDFWTQRWYRPLGACHADAVQGLLWSELDKGMGGDRSRFFGILEAYARSAESAAIPRLTELARKLDNPEADVNIVNAFADAAQVGSVEGINQDTAKQAVQAIVELAPELSVKGVEQARLTLQTLLAEEQSDMLAAVRYKDVKQEDDTFLWGLVISENADCKKGKKPSQRIHTAMLIDDGHTWADQVQEKAQASAEVSWTLDLAERCKVEGETTYHVPDKPFADEAAYKAWVNQTVEEIKRPNVKRPIRLDEEPIQL